MDFENEREPGRERNDSDTGANALGLGPALGKPEFGSGFMGRSTPEYIPGSRAHSRMGFSEAGSGGGGGAGSGTPSSYGLMESPTFTASSGSRDKGYGAYEYLLWVCIVIWFRRFRRARDGER